MRRFAAGNACRRLAACEPGLVGLYDRLGAFIGLGEVHASGDIAARRLVAEHGKL